MLGATSISPDRPIQTVKDRQLDADNMPDSSSIKVNAPRRAALIWTLAQIAIVWTVSDIGFYLLLPMLGLQPSYNEASIAITLYYIFWVGITVITFWPLYTSWSLYGRWASREPREQLCCLVHFFCCLHIVRGIRPSPIAATSLDRTLEPTRGQGRYPVVFSAKIHRDPFSATSSRCSHSCSIGPAI